MRKTLALAIVSIATLSLAACDWAHADGSDNLQEKDY